MTDEEESWRAWLALRLVRGVGPMVYQGLLRAFGDPGAVFRASRGALAAAGVRPEVVRAVRSFDGWALAEVCHRSFPGGSASTPTLGWDGTRVYLGDAVGALIAIDADDCSVAWSVPLDAQIFGSVAAASALRRGADRGSSDGRRPARPAAWRYRQPWRGRIRDRTGSRG